jgi:hypothetical protein
MAELLQQLVTRQAERRPDAVALVMNEEGNDFPCSFPRGAPCSPW